MDTVTNSIVNNLMNENIINFETATSVTDQTPVIKQSLLPTGSGIKLQPEKDEFSKQKDSLTVIKNPLWKKLLYTGLVTGCIIWGGFKLKNKIIPFFKGCFKNLTGIFKK